MSAFALGVSARRGLRLVGIADGLKTWTRSALQLGADAVVSVNEVACAVPGCAPYATIILVLRPDVSTRKLSIHKPMSEVSQDDVISGWLGGREATGAPP